MAEVLACLVLGGCAFFRTRSSVPQPRNNLLYTNAKSKFEHSFMKQYISKTSFYLHILVPLDILCVSIS